MRRVIAGVVMGGVVAGAAVLLASAYFARQVVLPTSRRVEDLPIRRVFRDSNDSLLIELPASARTTVPGRYSIWFANGAGHACIGEIVATDDGAGPAPAGTVTRLVERVDSGDLTSAKAGIWSGYVYPTPDPLGLPFHDVVIPVKNGSAPAWQFSPNATPKGDSAMWAIHIHGLGGTKPGALRGVPVANRLGYTSLVVSFRNDGEAPASADGRYHLGQSEWHDVEAAVSYAMDHGASRIVLFGWSLGGTIALQLTLKSQFRDRIAGLVLDAPVVDWTSTLMANARSSKLPRWSADLGLQILKSPRLRWITGLETPLNLKALDWVGRTDELRLPVLVIHSEKDRSTPFAVSRRFVDRHPDLATMVTFPSVEHTQEWNVDPEGWDSAVFEWLRNRVASV
ncbi:alpha/beta hydrolase family protein [Arthrobacter zhaoguopingii]|uniref:alpha/beta hydrolase family protein n=1 Tax=Arthrobacter zhaoguopingii TaxID=2681491 RepID=UPI001AEEFFE5|nr:alpha/beta fold hydrolase [Arthrobacter zhaoguopingii]